VGAAVLLLAAATYAEADSGPSRSAAARAAFKREQPCPSTGLRRGACPGYVIDHKQALCVGGPDAPQNMAWMTVTAAKAKDRWECKPGWEERLRGCAEAECFKQ
jgi:hypothetical protein